MMLVSMNLAPIESVELYDSTGRKGALLEMDF